MQQELLFDLPKVIRRRGKPSNYQIGEYKVVCFRELPAYDCVPLVDNPEQARDYWHQHIATAPHFNPTVETFALLMLNTRCRVMGHTIISTGTLDSILVHPRDVFRMACIAGAANVVLMHCHPSGDPSPSDADIQVTRDLLRAGELMKIEIKDHIIVGKPSLGCGKDFVSIRELGFCAGC